MLDALALGGEQLYQFGLRIWSVVITTSGGSSPGDFDGHVPLLAMLVPAAGEEPAVSQCSYVPQ
jgi:hypothetical protein